VVFERKHVGSGATGVCPGGIRQQFESEAECRLARRSMHFFEHVNEVLEPEFPFLLERSGYLFLAESEALLSRFRRNVAMQNKLGIPSRVVTPAEIAEIAPRMARDGIAGGSFCAEDGFLEDCDGLTHILLGCAREKGFQLALEEVISLRQHGGEWQIQTAAGYWSAKQIVIAAGTDSPMLAASAGVDLPITVERRRLAYSEPCECEVMLPLVVALERGFAGKQLRNGVFYIGWLGETAESDDLTFTEQALTLGATLLPVLNTLPVRRVVTGYYDSTPDHRPILGAISGLDGFYLATGFSGHGFMLAPAVGEMVAKAMAGSTSDRSPGGPVLGNSGLDDSLSGTPLLGDALLEEFSLQRFSRSTAKEELQI
jgi:sarcosine oxidase, subunit beta